MDEYINNNINMGKDDDFYNESFCNLVLDYLGSKGEFSKEDEIFLNENGYDVEDFDNEDY